MFRELLVTILGIWVQQVHADDGWCRASPQAGLPDYARCLPVDQAVARYVIELAPVVAFGLELKSDVKIVLEGSNGRQTKAISVASAGGGTIKRLSVDRVDVSDPEMIHAYLTSATAWACRQLTVWKDFRYWIFDCGEPLSPLNPEAVSRTFRSGGTTASFKVSRWIGTPYSSSAYIPRYPSGLELASQTIDCHTRAADVFEGLPSGTNVLKVYCPMNCQASEFAHTQGSSLHPASSSICTSAILDGVLSPSGGDILITSVGPVELYTGAAINGIESLDFASSPEKQQYSYHLYSVADSTPCDAGKTEFGQLSSVGRLEVKIGGAWGTVCNKGDFLVFSFEAAIKACQELGFKTGVPLLDGCKDVEGANLCAEKGYIVATAATCLEHNDDVVIKCTNNLAGVEPEAGTIRIVGPTGTPPQNGIGRLQLYNNVRASCLSSDGLQQREGREATLNQCPHLVSDDIYCVHEEDVVVACEGDGDPSGVGTFRKEEAVVQKIRPLKSWRLTCFDTLETKTGLGGPPGTTHHVVCPPNCGPHGLKTETPLTLPMTAGQGHTATSPSMQVAPASAQSNQAVAPSTHVAGLNAPSGAAQAIPPATDHPRADTSINPTAHPGTSGVLISKKEALVPQQYGKERGRISEPRAIVSLPSDHAGYPSSPIAKLLDAPTGVLSSVVKVKPQSGYSASPAGCLADGSVASSIRDFTVAVKAVVTGGEGKWRTLVAHSDCDGFALVVDQDNELIFEQTCHPHQLKSGFKPRIGEGFETAVTFSTTTRFIQLFVNGKPVASEKADFDISLRGRMVIGRASAAEADYFEGDILGVKLYNQEVQAPTIQSAFSPESLAAHIPQAPSETRRTDDGRLCLSACSLQIPAGAGAPVRPTKPAISLSCVDSLRRPEFNNFTGQKILAVCPSDCLHANAPLEGCKVFTSRSSICKAGLHAGAVPKEGGELVVTLVGGLTSYEASQGHYGIRSAQSTRPELRSFVVETAPPFRVLSCDATGLFTIKLGVRERELITCPPGCMARVHVSVYGTALCPACVGPQYMREPCCLIHIHRQNDTGGEVEIIASEARQRFAGSESCGVMSDSSGAYIRSFVFATTNLRRQPAFNSQPVASAGINRPVLPHSLN
ncbi:hypothetical protein Esti_000093 [Eimeria stiedai]